jgi:hypothetical protein
MLPAIHRLFSYLIGIYVLLLFSLSLCAQEDMVSKGDSGFQIFLNMFLLITLAAVLFIAIKAKLIFGKKRKKEAAYYMEMLSKYLQRLDSERGRRPLKKQHSEMIIGKNMLLGSSQIICMLLLTGLLSIPDFHM